MIKVKLLVWNDWNKAHIAHHDVIPDEVEEACSSDALIQQGRKGRIAVTGPTKNGRMITTILDPEEEDDVYFVVTAYPTSRRYRKIYEAEKGGEKSV